MSSAPPRSVEAPGVLPAVAIPETAPEVRSAGIAGVGQALPAMVVTNAPIAARLGVSQDWIVTRTGVRERRHAAPAESLTELATRAGHDALERAGFPASDLDLVLVATFTQDELLPNAAPLVARLLGANRAGAMDVGAACSGFLSALALAAAQVEAGRATAVLVVGAEVMSRVIDHDDRRTAGLFGDGAGAVLVTAGGPGRVGPIVLCADGAQGHLVTAGHAERKLRMRGQDTFRAAVDRLGESTREAVAAAELSLADIDLFVYHQANSRIIAAVGERLGLPPERVVDCVDRYGNTSAASIPIAMSEAERDGRLRPGDTVLLGAFAAGLTWGAGTLHWGAKA